MALSQRCMVLEDAIIIPFTIQNHPIITPNKSKYPETAKIYLSYIPNVSMQNG